MAGSSTSGEGFNGTTFTPDQQLGGTVLNCSQVLTLENEIKRIKAMVMMSDVMVMSMCIPT